MSARISALLFGAVLVLIGTAAMAEENLYSANRILPGCRALVASDRKLAAEQGICGGTVGTISYMGTFLSASRDIYVLSGFCTDTPDEATLGQMVRVVVAYIEARPAQMHEDFRKLALEALRTTWPCR